ncbi:SAVED domain-containing protein [Photobacterium carnosum]|uniref:SAVED domain-containing protein n=1 Tax=Photobacterium carnosum TaxID=2023717 RepID=UPI001E46CC94|nr:SAVED domain-containing protein [Photobacterium carnosum]MCD9547273.1 SAVED domain-containing protein [Photobacterium carnosum]MCF2304469.1 SAVED domain-containing protein [Photobacterium carnosum]
MMASLKLILLTIGVSFVVNVTYEDFSIIIDPNNSLIASMLTNIGYILGIMMFFIGCCIEVYERINGEASSSKRSKSIDLRSLNNSPAPKLCDQFEAIIDQAGLHDDLYLEQKSNESITDWLKQTCHQLLNFKLNKLSNMNTHEPMKPLALGSLAHVPQCFVLGFLVGNRRLVNYYCWNRDNKRPQKSKWVDTRDARDRGVRLKDEITLTVKDDKEATDVIKWGLSIEISFDNDHVKFMDDVGLDAVSKLEVDNKDIGNLFSEVAQVEIVSSIRNYINSTIPSFPNLEEIHLTITGQASFIMRLGGEFDQNHFQFVKKIHHFERKSQSYPWCLVLDPTSNSSVQFEEQ